MNTDRNLLFGVLALQADLIDSKRFAEACAAWAARKDVPLASILMEHGWITEAEKADVERLLERKLVADADARDTIFLVDDAATPHSTSSLALSVEHLLAETMMMPAVPRSRYTLTQLHAQGGLGRVWVARDEILNRDVALKELQPEHSSHPEACRRFIKEAQVTGQLEHPNIVPVYDLDRRPQDNQPFYTMQFVRGQTLHEAIANYHGLMPLPPASNEQGDKLSATVADDNETRTDRHDTNGTATATGRQSALEFRRILGAFVSVCNAVAYAHSHGVIHRDLKPDNVVLGAYGEVIVLDWGLAKLVDEDLAETRMVSVTTEAEADTTHAGGLLGTPAYMAPEQAEGCLHLIDARTDVYALGAILFEILTGHPPHEGIDTAELLRRVIAAPTPRALDAARLDARTSSGMKLKPRDLPVIPAALDAICAKAMAKQRDNRHTTATELADDVQRWLAGEPVSCYCEPWPARTARWMKQHRTLVTSAAAVAAMLFLGLAADLALVAQHNRRLDDEKQKVDAANELERDARVQAEEQEAKAKRSADQAMAVLRFFQNNVLAAARPRDQEGGLGRDATIRAAVDAAERDIADSFSDQPLVEATVRGTLGVTYLHLGEAELAIRQHERSLQLLSQHLGPDHPDTLKSKNDLAAAYQAAGKLDEARPLLEETLEKQKAKLSPNHPGTPFQSAAGACCWYCRMRSIMCRAGGSSG
jgi:serine/threonine protein kinase